MGVQYKKEVTLIHEDLGYALKYSCEAREGFENFCECKEVEKVVEESTVDQFLKLLDSLRDEGEEAKCCDHPWSEIEVTYSNGSGKKIAVSFPVEVEKIFNIDCLKS